MGVQKIYRATNQRTGEVLYEYLDDLSEKFSVSKKSLYGYIDREVLANGEWLIDVPENQADLQKLDKCTADVWKEWDDFTEPIRQYIRRRNAKKKQ